MPSDPTPDPAATLRRLEEIHTEYEASTNGWEAQAAELELMKMLPDLIPVVRRAVELEGENTRLKAESEATWLDTTASTVKRDLYDFALGKISKAEAALSAARESAASALKLLGIPPGPDPVVTLCATVPGMVAKLREVLSGLVQAVEIDANDGTHRGISGFTGARLSDARAELAPVQPATGAQVVGVHHESESDHDRPPGSQRG